jgi:uncharacterized membrane protein
MNHPPSDLALFFGRFHPVLVHLPIGFLLLAATLELLTLLPRFQGLNRVSGVVVGLAVPASAGGALCGWLLSQGGGYDVALLQWHKWSGLGVATASLATFLLQRLGYPKAYRLFLAGTCVGLVATSHYGGSLTHGKGYLVRYAPGVIRSVLEPATRGQPVSEAGTTEPSLAAEVWPIFDKYCVSCHGPEKAKGDLRLDTREGALKGGESGPSVLPGQGAASLVVKHLLLPLSAEQHMPPEGKPQPLASEIALIQRWIDAGAPGQQRSSRGPDER